MTHPRIDDVFADCLWAALRRLTGVTSPPPRLWLLAQESRLPLPFAAIGAERLAQAGALTICSIENESPMIALTAAGYERMFGRKQ